MDSPEAMPILDHLLEPLGDCLTVESARRVLALRADATLQARVNELAARYSSGSLSPEEEADYRTYVSYGTFIAILKSKARQLLANSSGP